MSSLKNRPSTSPKSREYDIANKPRVILSKAHREGILRYNMVQDYNNAIMTRDYEALDLYHSKVLPALKKALNSNVKLKMQVDWKPHNVLIKRV